VDIVELAPQIAVAASIVAASVALSREIRRAAPNGYLQAQGKTLRSVRRLVRRLDRRLARLEKRLLGPEPPPIDSE